MTGIRLLLTRLRGVRAVTELGRRRAVAGDLSGADAAFRLVIKSGRVHFGLTAALHRWVLHSWQGEPPQARAAFHEAIRLAAADQRASVGEACAHLGSRLGAGSRSLPSAAAARSAFADLLGSGDRDLAPKASLGLAMMLWGTGAPFEETRSAFRFAIDSGHPDCAAVAEAWLAQYLIRSGAVADDPEEPA